jgi:hypothetical protein
MSAVLDTFTGVPDTGLMRDAALEAQIDAAYEIMVKAPTDEESREHFSVVNRLLLQRSPTQLLKLELERRMRRKVKRA